MAQRTELPMGHVRGADPALWLELKIEATRRNMTIGELFNEILQARYHPQAGAPPQKARRERDRDTLTA